MKYSWANNEIDIMLQKIPPASITVFLISPVILMYVCCKPADKVIDHPIDHTIIDTLPHDTSFYTQGLAFYKGELYEGTGDPDSLGKSRLMKIDPKTGKALMSVSLSNKYFGEGITILRDTVYQLTWKQHKVFAYSVRDFRKVNEYNIPTEGWGLTNDGQRLIVSTGGGTLYYYDPSTFNLLGKKPIMEGNGETFNLNELEYIDGFIYANQYGYAYVLKIDPVAGKVVARYDLNDMWKKVKAVKPDADVPNGIAYDSTTKKIYVTGKYWPEMYEIKFRQ